MPRAILLEKCGKITDENRPLGCIKTLDSFVCTYVKRWIVGVRGEMHERSERRFAALVVTYIPAEGIGGPLRQNPQETQLTHVHTHTHRHTHTDHNPRPRVSRAYLFTDGPGALFARHPPPARG